MVLRCNCCLYNAAGARWELDGPRDCEDTMSVKKRGVLVKAIGLVTGTCTVGVVEGVEIEEIGVGDSGTLGVVEGLGVLEVGNDSSSEGLSRSNSDGSCSRPAASAIRSTRSSSSSRSGRTAASITAAGAFVGHDMEIC